MKKLLATLLIIPGMAMAHPGAAHSHPEELTGGMLLAVAAVGAYYIWKKYRG